MMLLPALVALALLPPGPGSAKPRSLSQFQLDLPPDTPIPCGDAGFIPEAPPQPLPGGLTLGDLPAHGDPDDLDSALRAVRPVKPLH